MWKSCSYYKNDTENTLKNRYHFCSVDFSFSLRAVWFFPGWDKTFCTIFFVVASTLTRQWNSRIIIAHSKAGWGARRVRLLFLQCRCTHLVQCYYRSFLVIRQLLTTNIRVGDNSIVGELCLRRVRRCIIGGAPSPSTPSASHRIRTGIVP